MVQASYRLDSGKLVYTMPRPYQIPSRPTDLTPDDVEPATRGPVASFAALGPLVDSRKEPVKDCQVQREGNTLSIEVPAGVRLLSPELDVHNAPMTLADVEGDFITQVRVVGNRIPGTEPPKFKGKNVLPGTFQGAGLLLWRDAKNYIRIERTASAKRGRAMLASKALVEIIKNGKPIVQIYPNVPEGPLYLRLQRIDGALAFFFGADGRQWATNRKLAVTFPDKLQVGLVASNMSKQPLTAQFEGFVLVTDKKEVTEKKEGSDLMKP
jgi:regulation of enolase protein 1 (concanavalin A-like superfamily)